LLNNTFLNDIFLEFPIDTLYPYHLVKREVGARTDAKSFSEKLVNMYLENYLSSLFAGAFDNHDFSPLTPTIPFASENQVQQAVELLSKSKKPVFLIGSQATLPPVEAKNLQKALESLNIPTFLGIYCFFFYFKVHSIMIEIKSKKY
jgi:acetolactate synthase-like protein